TPPVDTGNPYPARSEVTVLAAGDLAKPGSSFIGWATAADATAPEYQPGDVMQLVADTTLYAVWKVDVTEFSKAALADGYLPGQSVSFNISFILPTDVHGYDWLRIVDEYPSSLLDYEPGSAELRIGGEPVEIAAVYQMEGEISFIVEGDELLGKGLDQLVLTLSFTVANAASGQITNSARLFIVPLDGYEPEYPDNDAQTSLGELSLYTLTVEGGSGSGSYVEGVTVAISAAAAPAGKVFDRWIGADAALFDDVLSASTNLTMPAQDITISATYKPDTTDASLLSVLGISPDWVSGSGLPTDPVIGGIFVSSDVAAVSLLDVTVAAGASVVLYTDAGYTQAVDAQGSVTLAAGAITTVYVRVASPDGSAVLYYTIAISRAAPRYSLLVEGGSGSGSYVEGAAVTISAAAVPAGKVFDRWIGADAALFDDVLSPETNFTMPAQDVVLTALYRDAVLYPTAEQFGTHTGSGANSGRVGGPYNGFIRLTLDGAAIDPANYSVGAGLPDGTVITLHPGYLTTLANGTYVFRVEFTDGYAYITLVVDRPDAPGPGGGGSGGKLPVTGDSIGLLGMLGFADAFASGTLCILLWAVTGRRKPREERATKC
ncbi:MAG: InlB B-repeat-containing protein, partial [Coriobacteriia bacterium]|nr:InlB B-repeat-containing protein [Coriobacteriia bacterium]